MPRFAPALLATLLLTAPLQAATTGEEDQITINRLSGTEFEVVSGTFTAVAEYFWCGAATYIIRRQGQSDLTPLYVRQPVGPSRTAPGRRGVTFSTSSAGLPAAGNQLSLTVERPGVSLSARQARSYCRDAFTRSTK